MTVAELVGTVGLLMVVLTQFGAYQAERFEGENVEAAAAMLRDLEAGAERYLQLEYGDLEGCLRFAPAAGTGVWTGDARAAWDPSVTLYEAGPFIGVPLFRVNGSDATGLRRLFGNGYQDGCPNQDPDGDGVNYVRPRSLFEAGLLPASLHGLEYDVTTANPVSPLWTRFGLDARLVVRLVHLGVDPAATEPELGLQALLVVSGDELLLGRAQRLAVRTGLPGAGVLGSTGVGTVEAHRTAYGPGWRIDFCGAAGFDVELGGGAVTCPALQSASQDSILQQVDVTGDQAMRGGGQLLGDLRLAFGQPFGAAATRSLAGAVPPPGVDVPRGSLVFALAQSRTDLLAGVLYRVDIGIPEANRMETDIDFGTFGAVNVGYVSGIDADGDGVVDQGTVFVGPDPGQANPMVIHGDVVVTGGLQVGGGVVAPIVPVAGTGVVQGPGGTARLQLAAGAQLAAGGARLAAGAGGVVADAGAGDVTLAGGGEVEIRSDGGRVGITADRVDVDYGTRMDVEATGATGRVLVRSGAAGAVRLEGGPGTAVVAVEGGGRVRAEVPASNLAIRMVPGAADGDLVLDNNGSQVRFDGQDMIVVPMRYATFDATSTVLRQAGSAWGQAGDGDPLLSRTLQQVAGRYTLGGFGTPGTAWRCSQLAEPAGVAAAGSELLAVPHGWTAGGYAAVRNYRVVDPSSMTLQPPGAASRLEYRTGVIPVPEPYVGWWTDPETGAAGGAGAPAAAASAWTQLVVCDWN